MKKSIIILTVFITIGFSILYFSKKTYFKFVNYNRKMENKVYKPKNFNGNVILIGPEIFGFTQDIKSIAEKLSNQGYLCIILDFYPTSKKKSFDYDNKGRDISLDLFKSLNKEVIINNIKKLIVSLKRDYQIKNIGYLGFSSGAYIGYWVATEISLVKAIALVSPGWIADENFPLSKPKAPYLFSKNIKGSLLLIAGDKDKLVSVEDLNTVKKQLETTPVNNEIIIYSNTLHGFYIKSRSETYNENSSNKMWKKVTKFFKTKMEIINKEVLFVVTSHSEKGNTGKKTGYYLSEVSHPWDILKNAGYEIDFVSPKGGNAPVDGFDLNDPINKKFWENEVYRKKIENTFKPSQINPKDYVAIHFAGGHGTMWDFPNNEEISEIASKIYENNGYVSAVCHGPAGLVNIKLSNGKYLVDGKKVNAFTNEEEEAVGLTNVVPFLLETKLIERGAIFEKSGLWQSHVVVDQRLITGQNPASAKQVGEELLKGLK